MAKGILKVLSTALLTAVTMGLLSGCGGGGGASSSGSFVNLTPPSSLTADAGVQRVILNWSPVVGATSYTVYYATSPGVTKATGIKVADQHGPYTARDLANGTPYYFTVASVNTDGESPLSTEVSATPSPTPPPYAPTNVTAEAGIGQVRVSWAASAGAASYQIYYSTAPGVTAASPNKVSGAVSPQVVGSLSNGIAYYFVVTASNANGESAASFETSATPLTSPPPPAPVGLTAVEGDRQATVAWPSVAGATGYNLYYATDVNVTTGIGIKIANVSSPYVIKGLNNRTEYFFVVAAVNSGGEGAQSATASATPLALKPLPTLVRIPGGPFQMGDNLDGTAYAMPVRTVQVNEFYIDRYETTYDLWKEVYDWAVDPVRGAGRYDFDNPGQKGTLSIGTNMPVTTVNWYDVVKWQNARSEKEGRTPAYYTDAAQTTVYRTGHVDVANSGVKWDADGYRLPTEAEWEKADRGGLTGKRFPWGDELGTGNGNYNMGRTVSVGLYPPNGYGLYDMAGNVWEWTWDWGSDNYSWLPAGIVSNPRGPVDADDPASGLQKGKRIRRGGGYSYGYLYLRCFERMFRVPTYTAPYFGFRSASNQP